MQIRVKKLHEDAVLPARSTDTDAGYDLVAIDDGEVFYRGDAKSGPHNVLFIQYRTGISIEPDEGYHVEIFPRSSITKTQLILGNSIGLVDYGYRGEVFLRFKVTADPSSSFFQKYNKGDRVAQFVIRKTESAVFEWSTELSESDRGKGGFGSTGT